MTFNVTLETESNIGADPGVKFVATEPASDLEKDIAETRSTGQINVYVPRDYEDLVDGAFALRGIANRAERWAWLGTGNLKLGTAVGKEQWMNTLAHEIGHIVCGVGHPDDTAHPGPASLPLTERDVRLMRSGFFLEETLASRRRLLVKAEWDEAEAWLSSFIDL